MNDIKPPEATDNIAVGDKKNWLDYNTSTITQSHEDTCRTGDLFYIYIKFTYKFCSLKSIYQYTH